MNHRGKILFFSLLILMHWSEMIYSQDIQSLLIGQWNITSPITFYLDNDNIIFDGKINEIQSSIFIYNSDFTGSIMDNPYESSFTWILDGEWIKMESDSVINIALLKIIDNDNILMIMSRDGLMSGGFLIMRRRIN